MKRREFLKRIGAAGIALPFVSGLGNVRAFAQSPHATHGFARAANNSTTGDHILVIVRLFGGNDGLNTVVPFHDDNYYLARRKDATYDLALDPATLLPLPRSNTLALHPALAPLVPIYEQEKICIVQNIGYPDQDLSHFRSTDIWLSATDANVYDESGWLGRYLENQHPDYPNVLPTAPYAIEFGTLLSRASVGHTGPIGFALSSTSYIPDAPDMPQLPKGRESAEEEFVRQSMRQSNAFLTSIVDAQLRQPGNIAVYPATPLSTDLASVARLIAGGLSTSVYMVTTENYDFHYDQLEEQTKCLTELAGALAAFQNDIQALGISDRITTITISEFGRRVIPGGTGTDHGAASMMFAMGDGVLGGVIGHNPNVSDLEGPGNLRHQFDFRQVYASVLGQWLNDDDSEIVPSLYRDFAQLPIFRGNKLGAVPKGPIPQSLQLQQNIPNPVTSSTSIRVEGIPEGATAHFVVFDAHGIEVQRRQLVGPQQTINLDTRAMPSGTYTYCVQVGGSMATRKMTVRR